MLSKASDNGLWIVLLKVQHLDFENDITIQKYIQLQYF